MSQVDDGRQRPTPAHHAGGVKALPTSTIPHLAIPAGATSPIPSVLVEATRTAYTWTQAPPRPSFTWQRPQRTPLPWHPPAA